MEYWRRENARLSYEWDVYKFENTEPDLAEYTRKKELEKKKYENRSIYIKYLNQHKIYFKYFVVCLVLIVMVG